MSTESAIVRICTAPRDITSHAPSPKSIRGAAKTILRDLLKEIRRRQLLENFGELTIGEERLAQFVVKTYLAAVEETAVEESLPSISLASLTPEALSALLSTPQ